MARGRIGLFLHDSDNDYQKLMHSEAERASRQHFLPLDVLSAEKDAERQVRQIRAALAAPPSARLALILVSPVREHLLSSSCGEAARAGISWAFLTRWLDEIPELRREYPEVDLFSVSADQREIGRLQGQQLATVKQSGDEVIYISGPAGTSSARQRAEGIRPELDLCRSKLQTFYGDWSQDSGREVMQRWLVGFPSGKLPPCVIVGQNDNMAIGAREAVERACAASGQPVPPELRVLGCDGSVGFGQRLVSQGKLSATIVVPPVTGRAIEAFAQRVGGRGRPNALELVAVSSHPSLEALRTKYRRLRL